MSRLNKERQEALEPKRMELVIDQLTQLGIDVVPVDSTTIKFMFKGHWVTYYPYTGWATGKTIRDGRGLHNMLKQLI